MSLKHWLNDNNRYVDLFESHYPMACEFGQNFCPNAWMTDV